MNPCLPRSPRIFAGYYWGYLLRKDTEYICLRIPQTCGIVQTMNNASQYQYSVYLKPLPEGGFNVVVPAIPEICTFGETLEEAKRNAKEAIECVLESSLKRHEPAPMETHPMEMIKETIAVGVPR